MSEIPAQDATTTTTSGVASPPPAALTGWRFYLSAMLVVALAALLRALFIGMLEIWLDEAYCFAVARKSLSAILADLAYDNGPPLYYIMLHYWMSAFGDGPAALRSLSAVFSVATVAVIVFWEGVPWLNRTARLLAGFALAITPLSIYYAHEARMYAPVAFFVLASMVFLERGLRRGGTANWMLFAAATAASLYTSYAAIFLVPVGYLVVLSEYIRSRDIRLAWRQFGGLLLAHIVAAALFVPWLPTFTRQPSAQATEWIRPAWNAMDNKCALPLSSLSYMMTGGAYYPSYLRNLFLSPARVAAIRAAIKEGSEQSRMLKILTSIPPGAALFVMAAMASLVSLMALAGRGHPSFPFRTFLAGWALLSFMIPLGLSLVRPMFIPGRYDLTGAAAFALLTGIGLSRTRMRLRVPAVAVLSLLFAYTFAYMYLWPVTAQITPKAEALSGVLEPGDVAVCEAFEYGQTYYHIGVGRDDIKWLTFPRETKIHSAWIDYDKWLFPGWTAPRLELFDEARATVTEAMNMADAGKAVVIVHPIKPPAWADAMDRALVDALIVAVERGQLLPDVAASKPDRGIVVLRKAPLAPQAEGPPSAP